MRRSTVLFGAGITLVLATSAGASTTPNDPGFRQQWALANNGQTVNGVGGQPDADIDAAEAWDLTTGSDDVVIAVVDSGIDYDHPDLVGSVSGGWDVIDDDGYARDRRGHGTRVAGIAAGEGNNGYGIAGVSWETEIMPVRVGTTSPTVEYADLIEGVRYATANGARIVNLSVGKSESSAELERLIEESPETLFVAASGNGGADEIGDDVDRAPIYPCSSDEPNVVCVASTNSRDELAPSSNYGVTSVDLAAPGESVITTSPGHVFYDDLDATTTGWTRGGINNRWTTDDSGRNGYLVSEEGDYAPGTNSYARTKEPFSFADEEGCRLRYLADLEGDSAGDQLTVEVSTDVQAWTPVRTITQSSDGPHFFEDDVSFLDDRDDVYVRFRLVTDAQGSAGGALVDQVLADCERGPQDIHDFSYAFGTSFAAPHVAGAAALLWTLRPDAAVAEVKSALLDGVDRLPSLEGKVATGGRLNLNAALQAFRSDEQSPSPEESSPDEERSAPEISDVRDRPDPFTPDGDGHKDRSRIRFTLSESADVSVQMRTRGGRVVWRWSGKLAAGRHRVVWDGRRSDGTFARSGRYRYVIRATDPDGDSARAGGTLRLRR